MLIKTDCRHYRLDRPCQPHKKTGGKCKGCKFYDKIEARILLIKLGAMGDVLRTTALLPAIKSEYPGSYLTWLVESKSKEVLENLPDIDRLWIRNSATLALLQAEEFDWVINLDLSPESLALATLARAKRKSGFGLTEKGTAICWNPEAEPYLAMSYWDDLKKQNTKTYQQLMLDILNSTSSPGTIQIHIPSEEFRYARKFTKQQGLKPENPTIGLNLGAGGRWRWKRWTPEGFHELGRNLWKSYRANLLILSGPDEIEIKNEWIAGCDFPVIDAGHDNSYSRFAALVDLCDIVVTGDTMVLHLALGIGKKVVALFGPTSRNEVDLYGRGIALAGDVPCLCCYFNDCSVDPSCMQKLKSEVICQSIEKLLH